MKGIVGHFTGKNTFVEIDENGDEINKKYEVIEIHDKTLGFLHRQTTHYTLFYDNARCGTSEQMAELKCI